MLYRKYRHSFIKIIILLIFLPILFSCQFTPVYQSSNLNSNLCALKVEREKNAAPLYEIDFKNELSSILCTTKQESYDYVLKWKIKKYNRELIKSETNTTRRYEETIEVVFSIFNLDTNTEIYNDKITSKGAYNILEDEIISTISSRKSLESQLAISAARLTLDKINLYMIEYENSKLQN